MIDVSSCLDPIILMLHRLVIFSSIIPDVHFSPLGTLRSCKEGKERKDDPLPDASPCARQSRDSIRYLIWKVVGGKKY